MMARSMVQSRHMILLVLALLQLLTARCSAQVSSKSAKAEVSRSESSASAFQPSFSAWQAACVRLPSNRALHRRLPPRELLPIAQFGDFQPVLRDFFELSKTGALAQAEFWVGKKPSDGFFNVEKGYFFQSELLSGKPVIPFEPFAQKVVLPAGSEVFFHADLHGDIHSLMAELSWLNQHACLSGFKSARDNFYMVFLGDYTDRGAYGCEVLYTLFRLKVANPERVILLRGNHEDSSMQARYGFLEEGRAKYGAAFAANKIFRAYDFLPVVLYLGSGGDFIQCHHGGLEPGFDPRKLLDAAERSAFQLLGTLNQHRFLKEHPDWPAGADRESLAKAAVYLTDFQPENPISPSPIGFMWNDFAIIGSEPQFEVDPRRAFIYSQSATEYLLHSASTETQHLRAIFRGHQQSAALNPMMRRLLASGGIFRHWQSTDSALLLNASISELTKALEHGEERAIPGGSVWTFNVSPDSVYGEGCNYNFDSFGLLKMTGSFPDWRLQVVKIAVER